jgi:hypothetical protein
MRKQGVQHLIAFCLNDACATSALDALPFSVR